MCALLGGLENPGRRFHFLCVCDLLSSVITPESHCCSDKEPLLLVRKQLLLFLFLEFLSLVTTAAAREEEDQHTVQLLTKVCQHLRVCLVLKLTSV